MAPNWREWYRYRHVIPVYREADIASLILNIGTRRKGVANFTLRPLYPWEKSTRYALNRRLVGPQSRSGRFGGDKDLAEIEIRIVHQ